MPAGTTQLQLNFAERAVRRRPTSLVLGVMLSVVIFIVLFVSSVIAVNRLGGEITMLASQQQRVADENRQLRAEISRLQAPERIATAAGQLGLVLPDTPTHALGKRVNGRW